jgi:hypothetical protein|uniref:Uncharacterized protein n=1 Tax=Picea glauca TaxID=3330 RepID=A0A101M478_PICGL|nr:hypothetical protein ABT39_MTgene539 [Picea glauca]QHR89404.1 hypothetical protein Q903MT_gene3425 [Picea sitchensis]
MPGVRIVVAAFCDSTSSLKFTFIYDWTVYSGLKEHVALLRLMFERCKCSSRGIFRSAYSALLLSEFGSYCVQGWLADPACIVDLPPPEGECMLRA